MCVCTVRKLAEQQNLTTDNKLPHTAVLLNPQYCVPLLLDRRTMA